MNVLNVRKSFIKFSQSFKNQAQSRCSLSLEEHFKLKDDFSLIQHSQKLENLEQEIITQIKEKLQKKPTLSQKTLLEEKEKHIESIIPPKKPDTGFSKQEPLENLREDLAQRLQTFKIPKKEQNQKSEFKSSSDMTIKELATHPKKQKGTQDWKDKHFNQVTKFLLKINQPNNFVTMILQNQLKFHSFRCGMNGYSDLGEEHICTVSINFPKGWNRPKLLVKKENINSKTAMDLACMLLIKILFLENPQVWILFQNLNSKNLIYTTKTRKIPQSKQMEELIRSNDKYQFENQTKISYLYLNKKTSSEIMQDVCAKQQLQYILSCFPHIVSSPHKMSEQIIDQNGNKLWKVSTIINYKNKKTFSAQKLSKYRVTGEEEVCRDAISELYHKFPEFFDRVQLTKAAHRIAFGPCYRKYHGIKKILQEFQ